MPSGNWRTSWSSRCTASFRFDCSVSTTAFRASTCVIWSRSLSISLICSSSFAISVFSSALRETWLSMRAASTPWTSATIATPKTASAMASVTNCRWRASRFCSRWGSRLMRMARSPLFETAHRQPGGDHQHRRFLRQLARPDALGRLHRRERVGDHGGHAGALRDELVQPREQRAAAGQHDLVDLVVRRRREEELQRTRDLERQRFHERLEHVVVVVLRQSLVLARGLGFLAGKVECALDVLRQLIAAERLVAGE